MTTRLLASITLVAWLSTGCMTFEVEGDGLLLPDSQHGSETVHGSLYRNRSWNARAIDKCDQGSGLYRVEYYTNGLFLLASVATLGVYVPQSVEWWCQSLEEDEDDVEILEPSDEF